mmetsp:Transcript_64484/g.166479  ORF Transcript_64484/g.166479 Transcript_64484/m.166479 type:complete len:236 (+) Transcript_64484:933-1640(+)
MKVSACAPKAVSVWFRAPATAMAAESASAPDIEVIVADALLTTELIASVMELAFPSEPVTASIASVMELAFASEPVTELIAAVMELVFTEPAMDFTESLIEFTVLFNAALAESMRSFQPGICSSRFLGAAAGAASAEAEAAWASPRRKEAVWRSSTPAAGSVRSSLQTPARAPPAASQRPATSATARPGAPTAARRAARRMPRTMAIAAAGNTEVTVHRPGARASLHEGFRATRP